MLKANGRLSFFVAFVDVPEEGLCFMMLRWKNW